ncbi:MAG: GntR family transcriptional regulator [Alphaproteobacteria bacterium]
MTDLTADPTTLPDRDPTPAYFRIFQNLRRRIAAGEFGLGAQLPTEGELMAAFGVSRHTVRAAVQELQAQGLVRRQAGRGTFVTGQPSGDGAWAARSLEDMLNRNFGDRLQACAMRLLSAGSAEERDAQRRIGTSGPVMRFTWIRADDEGANAACRVDLPQAYADRLPPDWGDRIATTRLLNLVEACNGIEARRVRQVSTAAAAPADVAQILGVAPGMPLLSLERTYFDRDGGVIESSLILGRADRCRQVVELQRRGR